VRHRAAGLLVLAVLAVACGVASGGVQSRPGAAERAKPKPLRLIERCVRKSDHARVVRFRAADRARLIGVMVGKGPVGVAVGHEVEANLCNWLPFARILARRGFRVLAFDFRNAGSSAPMNNAHAGWLDLDFAAAAGALRKAGGKEILLGGASLGAAAALAAASRHEGAPAAVFSLSAPATWSDRLDGEIAVQRLTVPVLFLAAEKDVDFAGDARSLYEHTREADKQLLIVPGGQHGTKMLRGAAGAPARQALLAFVDRFRQPG
jgi:pimeloyl-ACP methyl ester carboxylesterase